MNNRLTLGTAQFGFRYGVTNSEGKMCLDEINRVMDHCFENGVDTLDTAQSYGNSEEILGNFHKNRFNLNTKIVYHVVKSVDKDLRKKLDISLKKLNLDHLHTLYVHNGDQLLHDVLRRDAAVKILKSFKESGLVSNLGLSLYEPPEQDDIFLSNFDCIQVNYNLLDGRYCNHFANLKARYGLIIQARSVFLQGLLLSNPDALPYKFRKWRNVFKDFHNHLNCDDHVKAKSILLETLNKEFIDTAVFGVTSLVQLKQILQPDVAVKKCVEIIASFDDELLDPRNW
jgi:aryl-alcohol dehydrogenase-like predicted oxidoreductase